MKGIVYHGSPVGGLAYIKPNKSTHGKKWVYAAENKALALVFSQHKNDYLVNVSFMNGRVEMTERVPNAFKNIFKGKRGYLYHLESSAFLSNQTSFSCEVVSPKAVPVLEYEIIDDIYIALLKLAKRGELRLYMYPNRPPYIPVDDSDLVEKTKIFLKQPHNDEGLVKYAIKIHPKLEKELSSLLE